MSAIQLGRYRARRGRIGINDVDEPVRLSVPEKIARGTHVGQGNRLSGLHFIFAAFDCRSERDAPVTQINPSDMNPRSSFKFTASRQFAKRKKREELRHLSASILPTHVSARFLRR